MKMFKLLCSVVLSAVVYFPTNAAATTSAQLWSAFAKGEAVVLMRHAIAPGGGDPVNFVVDDCNTQRNLSQEGRNQAKLIGDLFRSNEVANAEVFSSQWCRCLDTATALEFGEPSEQLFLNSFFQDRSTAKQQTDALRQWIKKRLENNEAATILPAILVTHQVNITALTSVFPASGEFVFVGIEGGELVVYGTINP